MKNYSTPQIMEDLDILEFDYTNYRGEKSRRKAAIENITYRSTEHHPEKQWIVRAYDIHKKAHRDFALRDIVPINVMTLVDNTQESFSVVSDDAEPKNVNPIRIPDSCRNYLQKMNKTHPRSGCTICGNVITGGCKYEKELKELFP